MKTLLTTCLLLVAATTFAVAAPAKAPAAAEKPAIVLTADEAKAIAADIEAVHTACKEKTEAARDARQAEMKALKAKYGDKFPADVKEFMKANNAECAAAACTAQGPKGKKGPGMKQGRHPNKQGRRPNKQGRRGQQCPTCGTCTAQAK